MVKATLYITVYMKCALFYTFSYLKKKKLQKFSTKIYRVVVSLVKIGAVENHTVLTDVHEFLSVRHTHIQCG